LQINKNLKDSTGIAYALGNLAGAYTLQEKYNDAETYLLQALNIRKRLKDSFALALNYSDLGTTYASSKNFEKARLYLDTSNLIADKMQYPELKQNNLGLLAELAEKQGDFKTALNYFSKRVSIRDSLFGLDKTKQIEELSTKYETVKKEQQIQEQQNRIVQQKIIIIAGIISLLLILALAYTQYKRIKWKQEAKLQAEILMQQELATKAIIKAEESERERIAKDLHDSIGQMLSAAKMNLSAFEYSADFKSPQEKQTFEKIITLVDESCKEVRTVSHHMMPNALVKNNLAAALTEFTARLDDKKLKVHLFTEGLDERLDTNVETVLYRVIQECVNNVIKHSDADTLDISVVKDLNEITATIEDNGKGFEVANKKDFGGIGLKNISTRIEYLKGSVDFDSTPGRGTLVAIHVPL
jgi:signal transduction histidine kinase